MKIIKSDGCTAFYTNVDDKELDEISIPKKRVIVEKLTKKKLVEYIDQLLYDAAEIVYFTEENKIDGFDFDKWYNLDYEIQIDTLPKVFLGIDKMLSEYTLEEKNTLLMDIVKKCPDSELNFLINTMIELVEFDDCYMDDEPCGSCGDYVRRITINL